MLFLWSASCCCIICRSCFFFSLLESQIPHLLKFLFLFIFPPPHIRSISLLGALVLPLLRLFIASSYNFSGPPPPVVCSKSSMIWPFFKISFDSSSSSSSSDHHQHHHHLLVAATATAAAYSSHSEVRSSRGREVLRTRKVQFQEGSKGRFTKMARLQWTPAWSVGLLIVAPTLLLLLLVQPPYSTAAAQRLQMSSSSTGVDSQLTSLVLCFFFFFLWLERLMV